MAITLSVFLVDADGNYTSTPPLLHANPDLCDPIRLKAILSNIPSDAPEYYYVNISAYTRYTNIFVATWAIPVKSSVGNSTRAYSVPFETVAARIPQYIDSGLLSLRYECKLSTDDTVACTRWYDVALDKTSMRDYMDTRGVPYFDETGTYIERGINTSSGWSQDDTGTFLRQYYLVTVPPHWAMATRLRIKIDERLNNAITNKLDRTSSPVYPSDSSTEQTKAGAESIGLLSGAVRATITLSVQDPTQSSETWITIDTITSYMSFMPPVLSANNTGDGLAIGKHASDTAKLLDVASDWDVNIGGDLTVGGGIDLSAAAVKQLLQEMYPIGSMIINTDTYGLNALKSAIGGTWSAMNYVTVGSVYLYYMTRTG